MSRPKFSSHTDPSKDSAPSKEGPRADRARDGAREKSEAAADARARDPGTSEATNPDVAELSYGWPVRDFLVSCILLTLSMQRAHGYFIEQCLQDLGLANVELSTLYRTLRKLEKDGLVSSTWEPGPEGPARRVYSLTDAGRWWLDMGVTALRTYRELIDHFFDSYAGISYEPKSDKGRKEP
ncbi:MAG: helix-turn-helix transcriptional regulator [Chloroflexi bacterium]|nr:helix-turn-helix transcriptional regulator [Chloroflexota bacterium]